MVFGIRTTIRAKGDDAARGEYEAVVNPLPGYKRPSSLLRDLIALGPLPALLFIAAGLMLTHHFFYTYLNDKSIDSVAAELPPLLRNQNDVNFIGTTIAHGARIVLSMAICSVFAQHFWETLRSRDHTIRQIDALVNCGQNPFHYTALRAATASFLLFTISVVASATALVVVLSPGSLTVSPNFERQSLCTVPSVPQSVMESGTTTNSTLYALVTYVLALNSYLPPFQTDPASTCGYETCSYNISFVGPALSCIDVTNETNFSSFLNASNAPRSAPFQIWNATVFEFDSGITLFSQDLLKGELQAANCTVHSAQFNVAVTLSENSSSVQLWNATPNSLTFSDSSFFGEYSETGLVALLTNLFAGPNGYTTYLARSRYPTINLQINPFFATTSTGNHTFSDSPMHFAESLFQNMSISLLSGKVYYGISNDTATNLETVNSTCSSSVTVYVYDSSRLLSAYSAMLGIGVVVVAYGCWLISRNGPEKKLTFSNVIRIGLNDEMMNLSGKLAGEYGEYRVQLQRTGRAHGKLLLILPVEDKSGQSSFENTPYVSLWNLLRFITDFPGTMALLILAAFCCMILNHAYYHYLDGRAPVTAMHSSGWLQNQSVASDIGIALAYICQIFLALAITNSCVQLFWRTIRSRGSSISGIDALMEIQAVSFPPSMFRALRTSWSVPLLSLLAASTSLLSIFAPGSIKVSANHSHSQQCTVLSPRNLSEPNSTSIDYSTPINAGMLSGTYLQPAITLPGARYSYDLEFVGPGFDCQDVTQSSNLTAFNAKFNASQIGLRPLFIADIASQTDDLTMRLQVQTWDVKRSLYQVANCTGVSRSYTVSISSRMNNPNNAISVTGSRLLAPVHTNVSHVSIFADTFLYAMMSTFTDRSILVDGSGGLIFALGLGAPIGSADLFPFSLGSGIYQLEVDGLLAIAENLTLALEEYAQNSTLSILSDTIFAYDSGDPTLLGNITTTCTFQSTAYEYSTYRLFVTYGVAIFVTILCAVWGTIAVERNGVKESMNFSRILQAILNEKMFNVRNRLDGDTVLKADNTEDGSLEPSNPSLWH